MWPRGLEGAGRLTKREGPNRVTHASLSGSGDVRAIPLVASPGSLAV